MRAIIALAIFIAATLRASAGCETSTLQVHTDLHLPIKVYVDGVTGNNPPTVGVTVTGITPGVHYLKVVEITINRYGDEIRRIVYKGEIDVHPETYMDARVDEGRGIAIHDTHVPCDQQYSYNTAEAPAPRHEAEEAIQETPPVRNERPVHNEPPVRREPQVNNNPPANNNARPNPSPAPATAATPIRTESLPPHMSKGEFQQLINTIIAAKYEIKKLDTLKTVIGSNQVSTDQVRQLMALFSFESNKLEVAKLLYDHTVDKQNYSALTASFNFDTNKEEFKKFLGAK